MEDKDIVNRILQHHETACFSEIMRKYSPMVFSKALGVVHNHDFAAEITQQTFIRAYTNLAQWNGARSLGPWLTVIAAHLSVNLIEKERRRRESPIERDLADTAYADERERRLQRMEAAIQKLPDADRILIHQHYYKQRKTSEIATDLNLTPSNVLVRLHRIREKLKSQLSAENDE